MATFIHDHVHLCSSDPEAMAQYYERMFGAEVLRSTQQGKPRVDLDLCGLKVFIAQVMPDGKTGAAPSSPYLGLDHIGLTVSNIDAAVAELKAKGANSPWSRPRYGPTCASPSCADRKTCPSN